MHWFKLGRSDSEWLGIPQSKRVQVIGIALIVVLIITALYILHFYI